MSGLAVTWWGHSSVTIELGSLRIGTDPLFVDRLAHLRRHGTTPPAEAADLGLVLVSHLHSDHMHAPSLRRVHPRAPIVVPRGARPLLTSLVDREIIEAVPGDRLKLVGLTIDVLPARHDGRRHALSSRQAPALGFRVGDGFRTFWYPGDTGPDPAMADIDPVDLALVPIGGWGPTLGAEHLGPEQAAVAVGQVGARWTLPVHHGTFWPLGLQRLNRANHRRLFVTPGPRFVEAMQASGAETVALLPAHGQRIVLVAGESA